MLEPIRKGTQFNRRYTFETAPSTPRDLTGITITFVIQDSLLAPHTYAVGTGVTVTPLSGIVDIALTPTQTALLEENNGAISYVNFLPAGGAVEAKAHEVERIIAKEAAS